MDNEQIKALADSAVELHGQNHNCAQCVSCTLASIVGYDKRDAFRFTEGLGGGMGAFKQTCGALIGAGFAVSAASSDGYDKRTTKQITYGYETKLQEAFNERFGGTYCCDLRPSDPDQVRPTCEGYIAGATEIAANIINEIKA